MIKSIDKLNCVNGIGTFQISTSGRCRPSQTAIQQIHHPESKFVDFLVWGKTLVQTKRLEKVQHIESAKLCIKGPTRHRKT